MYASNSLCMNFSLFELKVDFFKKITVPTEACEEYTVVATVFFTSTVEEEEAEK